MPLQGITVNGQSINITSAGNASCAKISTRSNEIRAPKEVVERIYAAIPGAKLKPYQGNPHNLSWVFPCESTPNISVSLNIGGDEYTISPVDMVMGLDLGNVHGDGWTRGSTPANGSCVGLFRGECVGW